MEEEKDLGSAWEYRGCVIPKDLYYYIDLQVWVRVNEDGTVSLGITEVGQTRAGKILHIRTKSEGKKVQKGKPVATLESGKWAGPVPALVEGEIVEVNERVLDDPSVLNVDPYGQWIVKIRPESEETLKRDLSELVAGERAYEEMKSYIEEWDIICMKCIEEEIYAKEPREPLKPSERHVILLTAAWCSASQEADALWRKLRDEFGFRYEVLDVETPEGRFWVTKLLIKSVPTTIIDGEVAFVGVPKEEDVRKVFV